MRENSYNQWKNACDWNLSYANRTSTTTVLENMGNNQSDQFDSSSNVDVGSKCNIDAFSGRKKNMIVTCMLKFNFNIDLKMRFNLMTMTLTLV